MEISETFANVSLLINLWKCYRALEIVMERCWDKDPRVRPNIGEVVEDMSAIAPLFPPADADPLAIPEADLSSRTSQVWDISGITEFKPDE